MRTVQSTKWYIPFALNTYYDGNNGNGSGELVYSGSLKYANCSLDLDSGSLQCDSRSIDEIGVDAYGVFPEMDYVATFSAEGPFMSYIDRGDIKTEGVAVWGYAVRRARG